MPVFLRTLEYYEGILFLTTNRVGVFDEAFKSRIHMSLYYPSLNRMQTVRIWERHIKEAAKADIRVNSETLVDLADTVYETQNNSLSGTVWNGRQIRNAFQSAVALAAFHANGGPIHLECKYFENVFQVSDQFSSYIWTTKNYQNDADRNRLGMVRRDDFTYHSPSTGESALQSRVQQPRQLGGFLQSTYGQRIPPSPSNFGLQKPPQGGSPAGLASYPTHAQRLDNIQAAAMRQANNPASGLECQQPAPMLQNQVNPESNYILQPHQQSQYTTHQANYGTAKQQPTAPQMLPSMGQPMLAPTQMVSR
jgi:hypothetical protein